MEQIAIVKYQVGEYSGEVEIACDYDDDDLYIIAKARRLFSKYNTMSMCYESYKVIDRYDNN